MAQDFYDPIQVFDYIADRIDDNKASLGLRYVARQDSDLLPEYPAILISMERAVNRSQHATQQFLVTFGLEFYIFHARLTTTKQVRSRDDVLLATSVRKLLHADYTLGGHINFGYVEGEFPRRSRVLIGAKAQSVVTTHLTWTGQNRVPYSMS